MSETQNTLKYFSNFPMFFAVVYKLRPFFKFNRIFIALPDGFPFAIYLNGSTWNWASRKIWKMISMLQKLLSDFQWILCFLYICFFIGLARNGLRFEWRNRKNFLLNSLSSMWNCSTLKWFKFFRFFYWRWVEIVRYFNKTLE